MGRYWVNRKGEWLENLMVVADSPAEALKIAATIPTADWAATRESYELIGKNTFSLSGVSLSDTREAWNEPK